MKKQLFILLLTFIAFKSYSQNLFSKQFDDCHQAKFSFCLDCGETKAKSESDLNDYFQANLTNISPKLKGEVFVQVIIDSIGNQCVKSLQAKTNRSIRRLKLKETINAMTDWKPAISSGKPKSATVVLLFQFNNGKVQASYKRFNTKKLKNLKSVGSVKINKKRKFKNRLNDNQFEVFTTQNSIIPWDMSRAITKDQKGIIWHGTDNGIVRIENGEMTLFNHKNSPLKPTTYNREKTRSIMYSAVDELNNKWFIDGYNAYKFDNNKWQVYDSINSPLGWTTEVYTDKSNNAWFTSSKGLIKFDGNDWTVLNSTNSMLPSNRVMGVFVDSKNRIWIGTNKGNIRIDGDNIIKFENTNTPLSTATLSKGYEDAKGNIWFSLYEKFPQTKALAKFKNDGTWEIINTKTANIPRNDVLDFVIDENNNRIWLSLNKVGLSMFDGEKWQTFTPENSKIPSTYIQRITIDDKGNLWGATFAGLLKIKME